MMTTIIEQEDDWYVALCPELDIASQGRCVTEAKHNRSKAQFGRSDCALLRSGINQRNRNPAVPESL